jgi:hypothetical protein
VHHGNPGQARDSLHPSLAGFTCYFLGTPKKYPGIHTCRLSVNSEKAPPSQMTVLPGQGHYRDCSLPLKCSLGPLGIISVSDLRSHWNCPAGTVSISNPQFPIHKMGQKSSKPPKDNLLTCLFQNLQTLGLTKPLNTNG